MSSLWGLTTAILVAIALLFAGSSSAGRDLRPSEHGLFFQASPPANSSPDMRSFFSTKGSSPSDVPLSNVTESLPPQWWGVGGARRSHVGQALMTASLVCGITGGILLVASVLLYLFKHRKKPHQNESFRASNTNNNNNCNNVSHNNSDNKLQLVAVASDGFVEITV